MAGPLSRQVERRAIRTHVMMRRLGVDPMKLIRTRAGDAYAEARTRCLNCTHARECLLWLDAHPASLETPTFCPNFDLFQNCRQAETQTRHEQAASPDQQATP